MIKTLFLDKYKIKHLFEKILAINQKSIIIYDMKGGKRPGAGRPKGTVYPPEKRRFNVTVRLPLWLFDWLKNHPEPSGRLIERALIMTYDLKEPKKKKRR